MQAVEETGQGEESGTKRFRAKRDAILAAAAEAINEQSAKGMTFADVARRVGLNTTSVTYYFKRKEDLAAACFEYTLDYLLLNHRFLTGTVFQLAHGHPFYYRT